MKRRRLSWLATVLGPLLLASSNLGCITRDGLAQVLADDLALSVSAATQGFLRGVFAETAE